MFKAYCRFGIFVLLAVSCITAPSVASETDVLNAPSDSNPLVGRWTLRLFRMEQNISTSPDEVTFGCWNMQLSTNADDSLTGEIENNGWTLPLSEVIQSDSNGTISFSANGKVGSEKWTFKFNGRRPVVADASVVGEQSLVGTVIFDRQPRDSAGPSAYHWIAIKQTKYPVRPIDWNLMKLDGVEFSSAELLGRPALIIFSQGFSCVHCNEQITSLQASSRAFEGAGVTVLVVVSDSARKLSTALKETSFSFEFLADPKSTVFEAFGLDDMHLTHGAVVLDRKGVIRWRSLASEPEMDMDQLLKEIERINSSSVAEIKNDLTSRIQK